LAVSYFNRASKLGLSKALTKVAHYHYSGYQDDTFKHPVNVEKALELYLEAEKFGDAEAANCLGLIFE
jgi:TPR repeat protein